jgi:hypothetical protein
VGDNPTTIKVLLLAPTGTAAYNIHGVTIYTIWHIHHMEIGQHIFDILEVVGIGLQK